MGEQSQQSPDQGDKQEDTPADQAEVAHQAQRYLVRKVAVCQSCLQQHG